ncbi:hypothetical protein CDAR_248781 [Caerostris darwini]|uniref:Uncharacterized protein n=1 Tax=Caerostris darwini TaxID=1538125 RepID=A0AAV4UAQ9_9ARAC|nr:hypothetical protein CDAR_248781 [Caerostris darwini]
MDCSNPPSEVARAKNVRFISGVLWSDDVHPPPVDCGGRRGRRGAVVLEEQPTARESGGRVARLFRRLADFFRRAITGSG